MAIVTSMDSISLRDQLAGTEGVLPYPDGMKYKPWDSLKGNIGRRVPVIDEHPPINNGKKGLITGDERKYGIATIKACPLKKNALCFDVDLDDDAPDKDGYSMGYPYLEVEEKGEFNGIQYDAVQRDIIIDHIALTNNPRNPGAKRRDQRSEKLTEPMSIAIAGDDGNTGTTVIQINRIGYDSFNLNVKVKNNIPKRDTNMVPEPTPLTPAPTPTVVATDTDREALIKELATLKAEKSAHDSIEKKVTELQEKLKAEHDSAEKYKSLFEKQLETSIKIKLDSLVAEHGFAPADFQGKTPDFVDGVLFAASKISKGATDVVDEPKKIDGIEHDGYDENGLLDVNSYIVGPDGKLKRR